MFLDPLYSRVISIFTDHKISVLFALGSWEL